MTITTANTATNVDQMKPLLQEYIDSKYTIVDTNKGKKRNPKKTMVLDNAYSVTNKILAAEKLQKAIENPTEHYFPKHLLKALSQGKLKQTVINMAYMAGKSIKENDSIETILSKLGIRVQAVNESFSKGAKQKLKLFLKGYIKQNTLSKEDLLDSFSAVALAKNILKNIDTPNSLDFSWMDKQLLQRDEAAGVLLANLESIMISYDRSQDFFDHSFHIFGEEHVLDRLKKRLLSIPKDPNVPIPSQKKRENEETKEQHPSLLQEYITNYHIKTGPLTEKAGIKTMQSVDLVKKIKDHKDKNANYKLILTANEQKLISTLPPNVKQLVLLEIKHNKKLPLQIPVAHEAVLQGLIVEKIKEKVTADQERRNNPKAPRSSVFWSTSPKPKAEAIEALLTGNRLLDSSIMKDIAGFCETTCRLRVAVIEGYKQALNEYAKQYPHEDLSSFRQKNIYGILETLNTAYQAKAPVRQCTV